MIQKDSRKERQELKSKRRQVSMTLPMTMNFNQSRKAEPERIIDSNAKGSNCRAKGVVTGGGMVPFCIPVADILSVCPRMPKIEKAVCKTSDMGD